MIKVYPVTQTQEICDDYEVFVNGVKAPLNTARVSAYPYNRRWPGHQRQIEQTELINFLSMQANEEVELKIIPKNPTYTMRIRPRSVNAIAQTSANNEIIVRVNGATQFTVEPCGRNHALHVFIDSISNYEINKPDENFIYYGKGEHNVGDIHLKSGQTLFIDEGAVVYATVYGKHAKNVKILGRGILDNSKNKEKILYDAIAEGNDSALKNATRAHTISLIDCENVEIDGITIRDSLVYNINCLSCKNVKINEVKIIGCWRFNSDGVHFANCVNCVLENSFLRTYDDSICVRGFANYDYEMFLNEENEENLSFVCQDVLIRNCVIWNDWGKNLQVGTETFSKEIKNVRFEDCKIIHTSGYSLTIWLVDNAKIHDVIFKDILVEYDDYILKMEIQNSDSDVYVDKYDANYGGRLISFEVSKHFEYSLIKTEEELGNINGVKIQNLQLYSVQKPVFVFRGDNDNSLCENVQLSDVFWNGERISQELFEKQISKNDYARNIILY